jgi:glucose-6-phosphate dehydrogenase assembly protein OpcA
MSADAGQLLKELDAAWAALGHQESGVLRACSMTFIVLAGAKDDAQELGGVLADLMHEHPSRTIVLRLGDAFDARVTVQCWMPFGQRQQICCEQIEIVCTPQTMDEAAALLLGLTVPDLPVNLWLRGGEWLDHTHCSAILRLADKVIADGARLGRLPEPARPETVIADLAWTRITRWRQTIFQILENRPVERLDALEIHHAGTPTSLAVRYLGAWLQTTLGLTPAYVADPVPPPPPGVGRTRAVHLAGPGFELQIERPGTVEVSIAYDGHRTQVIFPLMTEERLLHDELAVFGRDPVFERTRLSMA